MRAGLDIARLWLPGEAAILTVEGRDIAGAAAVLQVCLLPICCLLTFLLWVAAVLQEQFLFERCRMLSGEVSIMLWDVQHLRRMFSLYHVRNACTIVCIEPSPCITKATQLAASAIQIVAGLNADCCYVAEGSTGGRLAHDNCPLGSAGEWGQRISQ